VSFTRRSKDRSLHFAAPIFYLTGGGEYYNYIEGKRVRGNRNKEEKTTFEIKGVRLAALVLVVTGAAIFVSCQAEVTGPESTPKGEARSYDTTRIWGYTKDGFGEILLDVNVAWWCNTCAEAIGEDAVDDVGRYNIDPPPPFNWDDHDGHDLEGEATKPSYSPASQYIYDFDSSAVYQRDFYLYEAE
jgi:hypothetical protein